MLWPVGAFHDRIVRYKFGTLSYLGVPNKSRMFKKFEIILSFDCFRTFSGRQLRIRGQISGPRAHFRFSTELNLKTIMFHFDHFSRLLPFFEHVNRFRKDRKPIVGGYLT